MVARMVLCHVAYLQMVLKAVLKADCLVNIDGDIEISGRMKAAFGLR
jgi:hypothetical protein